MSEALVLCAERDEDGEELDMPRLPKDVSERLENGVALLQAGLALAPFFDLDPTLAAERLEEVQNSGDQWEQKLPRLFIDEDFPVLHELLVDVHNALSDALDQEGALKSTWRKKFGARYRAEDGAHFFDNWPLLALKRGLYQLCRTLEFAAEEDLLLEIQAAP